MKQLYLDAKNIMQKDPAARNILEVMLLYPGFHILVYHRIAHFFYKIHFYFIARWISQRGRFWTGIEIHPGATIGKCLFIDHGMGVVIGETAEIGDYCLIYQGCTLGGTGKEHGKRHPTLGNNVMVGSGAKIAANAVVLEEVPPNCTAVGVPARIVRRNGKKTGCEDLDQIHIPDPVAQELCAYRVRLDRLEKQVEELKKEKE